MTEEEYKLNLNQLSVIMNLFRELLMGNLQIKLISTVQFMASLSLILSM